MKLTGKCKEDFFKSEFFPQQGEVYWSDLTPSMQYGVYVDFFDSVGIYCENEILSLGWAFEIYKMHSDGDYSKIDSHSELKTRHEARTKAIEKANDIYNEKMVS